MTKSRPSRRSKDQSKDTCSSSESSPDSSKKCEDEPFKYSPFQVKLIQNVYLLGIIAWILLVFVLGLFPTCSIIEFLILLIPIGLFLLAWKSTPFITNTVENFMFQTNLLTFGLLIALPILSWVYDKSKHNKSLFLGLISTAIIFSILALFDIWVPHCYLPVITHIKSILQTFALALFVFLLYRFFVERGIRDKAKQKDGSNPSSEPSEPRSSFEPFSNSFEPSSNPVNPSSNPVKSDQNKPIYYDL